MLWLFVSSILIAILGHCVDSYTVSSTVLASPLPVDASRDLAAVSRLFRKMIVHELTCNFQRVPEPIAMPEPVEIEARICRTDCD